MTVALEAAETTAAYRAVSDRIAALEDEWRAAELPSSRERVAAELTTLRRVKHKLLGF